LQKCTLFVYGKFGGKAIHLIAKQVDCDIHDYIVDKALVCFLLRFFFVLVNFFFQKKKKKKIKLKKVVFGGIFFKFFERRKYTYLYRDVI
jgi:hypothetical protein